MLRNLGIAFIVCAVLFAISLTVGLSVWAVSSGKVRIAGVNDQPTDRPITLAQLAPESAAADFRRIEGPPVRHASMTTSQSVLPVSMPAASLSPSLETDALDRAAAALRATLANSLRLMRISAQAPSSPTLSWEPSASMMPQFPSGAKDIVFVYSRSDLQPIDEAVFKSFQTAVFNLRRTPDTAAPNALGAAITGFERLADGLEAVSLVENRTRLMVKYTLKGEEGQELTGGLDASFGAGPSQKYLVHSPGQVSAPMVGGVFNGKFQATTLPIPLFNGIPVSVYDYLRLQVSSPGSPLDLQFYLQKNDTQSVQGGAAPVSTTQNQSSTIVRLIPAPGAREIGTQNHEFEFTDLRKLSPTADGYVFAISTSGQERHFTEFIPLRMIVDNSSTKVEVEQFFLSNQLDARAASRILSPRPVYAYAQFKTIPTDLDVVVRTSDLNQVVLRKRLSGSDNAGSLLSLGQFSFPGAGPRDVYLELYQGGRKLQMTEERVAAANVNVLESGPTVSFVDLKQFMGAGDSIVLHFAAMHPLKPGSDGTTGAAQDRANYSITPSGGAASRPDVVTYDNVENTVTLKWNSAPAAGTYKLVVKKTLLDAVDNPLQKSAALPEGKDYEVAVSKGASNSFEIDELITSTPSEQRGLTSSSGPYIPFQEYLPPREYSDGFNPSDKVVTRVARLYYFRDAHRVSQIVNRKAKSYNRAGVDMKQQFADAKKRESDLATSKRREFESLAVRASQQARAAENALDEQQKALTDAREGLASRQSEKDQLDALVADQEAKLAATPDSTSIQDKLTKLRSSRDSVQRDIMSRRTQVSQIEERVRGLMARIQTDRDVEIRATEKWEGAEEQERLRSEELFRREVAAKKEDPDTYAPGSPESDDPVEQVSISVVGEGLIQLRGPRKGVNEVHKMINELDSPVGQVKISVHTVQVNGEGGERMEEVVHRIQRYLDHSRFLTMQSAQMLRNAVVTVASRRAEQIALVCPPGTPQQDRDFRYQEAFFGSEFIQELKTMDSEFLQTGNKVLSLNSMDTTSLSNALFLLSLAKNDVQKEILLEFQSSTQCQLPQYEIDFYQGSAPKPGYKDLPLKERLFSKDAHRDKLVHKPDFQLMAQNAQFASFRGFFDSQIAGPDTLNPMQREFLRLAQIFKARLITEIELRQRVMERSLIEQRLGDYRKLTLETQQREILAKKALDEATDRVNQEAARFNEAMRPNKDFLIALENETSLLAVLVKQVQGEADVAQRSTFEAVYWAIQNKYQTFSENEFNRLDFALLESKLFPATGSIDPLIQRVDRLARTLEPNSSAYKAASRSQSRSTEDQDTFSNAFTEASKVNSDFDDNNIPSWLAKFEVDLPINGSYIQIRYDGTAKKWVTMPGDGFSTLATYVRGQLSTLESMKTHLDQFRLIDAYHRALKDRADDSLDWATRSASKENEELLTALVRVRVAANGYGELMRHVLASAEAFSRDLEMTAGDIARLPLREKKLEDVLRQWNEVKAKGISLLNPNAPPTPRFGKRERRNEYELARDTLLLTDKELSNRLSPALTNLDLAIKNAEASRRPLDHKKFLDMLIDDVEEKFIELVEGTRAQTSNIDNYLKRLGTALEDDFNSQFYNPAFRNVRETSYYYDVSVGQVETTSVVANNRMFAKVSPQATMEFDLPKRDILINEAMNSALAAYNDYGALLNDPHFLSLMKMYGGQAPSATYGGQGPSPYVQEVLPGLPSGTDSQFLTSPDNNVPRLGANLEALIPDPAIYKFETGTGYEIRPVIQPDGQSVTFHFNYMYTTNVREPVRADEKHLGRVKRHFIDTDVVSGNYELREISTYRVGLKAARSSRGVPLLEDVPAVGVLFRPQINEESSLQQNIVLSQSVIYPTLFDLMGLRWAPAVADLDALSLQEREFVTRNREKYLRNEVFDYSSLQVDEFMRIPEAERRGDLYRTQETIPDLHPNQYQGPGLNLKNGVLQEGYAPEQFQQQSGFVPSRSEEAQFQLETPPRQGMMAVPLIEAAPGGLHGSGDYAIPVSPHQYEIQEGALPLENMVPAGPGTSEVVPYFQIESNNLQQSESAPASVVPGHSVSPSAPTETEPPVTAPVIESSPVSKAGNSMLSPIRAVVTKGNRNGGRVDNPSLPQNSTAPPQGGDVTKASMTKPTGRGGLSRLIPGAMRRK